jgi:DNA-binding NarL/FixJ family response regulator
MQDRTIHGRTFFGNFRLWRGTTGQQPTTGVYTQIVTPPVRILFADDSDVIRQAVCAFLKNVPDVTVVGEARDFGELLRMHAELTPDIVLLDLHMPDQKSFDVATVRAGLHGSCVIAVCIWNDKTAIELAQSYGAVKLLDKGELYLTLIPTIKECLPTR